MDEGTCANTHPRFDFFTESAKKNWMAMALCNGARLPVAPWTWLELWVCPVREECLDYSLEEGIEFGVWGGVMEGERKKMMKERRDAGE